MEEKNVKYSINSHGETSDVKNSERDNDKTGKRTTTKFSIVIAILTLVVVSIISCLAITLNIKRIEVKKTNTAIEIVQDLYQFSKVEDLDKNMLKIKDLTTKSVYNQLTVDNEERTLNTYLKFKGDATSVNVVKATSSYILYTLTNKNIDKDRVFIFMYECNEKGKISSVRESECLDFLK